jgi:hypothetical protein
VLILVLCVDVLTTAVRQIAPALADHIGAGVEGFSTLLACAGVGALGSTLWLAYGGTKRFSPSNILFSFPAFLMSVAALSAAHNLVWGAASALLMGCGAEICRTGTIALLQTSIPDTLRARVMSTQFLLRRLASALGVVPIGVLTTEWGLRGPILWCVALAVVVWGVVFLQPAKLTSAFDISETSSGFR